jgi:hypothetical protein
LKSANLLVCAVLNNCSKDVENNFNVFVWSDGVDKRLEKILMFVYESSEEKKREGVKII